MNSSGTTHVLIPVKAFASAKRRLASSLNPAERSDLARAMATGVVAAASSHPVWIVCDDDNVAAWARSLGTAVSWQPGSGLNGAVSAATRERFEAGADRVIVVHSDLPMVRSLDPLIPEDNEIVLAPDRHDTGTNALCTPTGDFRFAYGPGSFRLHLAEAKRLGLPVRILHDTTLGWDVDEPEDLAVFSARRGETG